MKAIFVLCWILLLTHLPAFPQTKFGIRGDLGTRFLIGNEKGDIGFGYRAGIISEMHFSSNFSLMPSLCFARKGYVEAEYDMWLGYSKEEFRLDYLDLYCPLTYPLSHKTNLFLGPFASVLITARNISVDTYFGNNGYVTDNLNDFDAGVTTGILFEYKYGNFIIQGDYGFINALKGTESFKFRGNNLLVTGGISVYIF